MISRVSNTIEYAAIDPCWLVLLVGAANRCVLLVLLVEVGHTIIPQCAPEAGLLSNWVWWLVRWYMWLCG